MPASHKLSKCIIKNVKAVAVNPCIDSGFPNADFDDDNLVSCSVIVPHIPHEQFGLVPVIPNGTKAEHAESSIIDLNLPRTDFPGGVLSWLIF